MKQIYTIKPHSFVDIITNSSTELFTADTNKDVEAVKEILEEILDSYDSCMDVIGHVFKFSYKEYLKAINDTNTPYDNAYREMDGWFADDSPEALKEEQLERISNKSYNNYCGTSLVDNSIYDLYEDYIKSKYPHLSGWSYSHETSDYRKEVQETLYNDIINGDIKKPLWWNEPWKVGYGFNKLIKELEGQIIIISESDNSIPFDAWGDINYTLNAHNYHLG